MYFLLFVYAKVRIIFDINKHFKIKNMILTFIKTYVKNVNLFGYLTEIDYFCDVKEYAIKKVLTLRRR